MTTKEESMIITKYDLLYEQRMTRVETTLESFKEIKTDLRLLIGIMLGGFAGLFGLIAHGFHWII